MYLRARSKEQIDERKKSIIKALDSLYMSKELSSICLKDVALMANISRTAIYSYYSRKEEILLDSLFQHFVCLDDALESFLSLTLTEDALVSSIANAFEGNIIILKIMSTNLEDIERSTKLENLVILKTELKRFQLTFQKLLTKQFPNASEEKIRFVLYSFITMLYGYYSVAHPAEIQEKAMELTSTQIKTTLKELIATSLLFLINNLK